MATTRLRLTKRSLALLVALVLAAVATAALAAYVNGVEDRALADEEPVEVYVAKDTIPHGTSGTAAIQQGLIDTAAVPKRVVPDGAISRLGDIEGLVTNAAISRGEELLASRFVRPEEAGAPGTLLNIPEGDHAMSVEVGVPPGVAGYIQKGDRVGIIAHFEEAEPVDTDGDGQPDQVEGAGEGLVRFLLQGVQVLEVGQRVAVQEGEDGVGGNADTQLSSRVLLTLALSPNDAERVAFANFRGDIYFTLMPPDAEPTPTGGRTGRNVFQP